MKELPEIARRDGRGAAAPMGEAVLEAGKVVLPQRRLEGRWLRPVPQWRAKNLDPVTAERTDLGFIDLNEDRDHFVRRQQLLVREDHEVAVQFALALYARGRGEEIEWDEDGTPVIGGQRIPLEKDGLLRINYVGPPSTFKDVVSFRDVLADARTNRPAQGVRGGLDGAVVLIGMTARGGQDYHATPFSNAAAHWSPDDTPGLTSGTEVQANVYATLHDRAFIRPPGRLGTLAALLIAGGLLGWVYTRYNLIVGAALAVVHHFAWKGIALAAFSHLGWRVPVVAMLLLGLFVYMSSLAWRWRVLLNIFELIKGATILNELWKKSPPQKYKLTVMFVDIRGFTTFSEEHEPSQVAKILNAYFTTILPAIQAEGGTVN